MKIKLFSTLVTILFLIVSVKAQPDIIKLKSKYFFGFGSAGGGGYLDNGESYFLDLAFHPKFGYFISPHFMPYIGLDLVNRKSTFDGDYKFIGLNAVSPGIRYYLTKKT